MPALSFKTTVSSPNGPALIGRYAVDSPSGSTPSTKARIGDAASGTAYRCEMDLADALAVRQSIAELAGDTTDAVGSRQKTRDAGSVEVIEPSDNGVIEVRTKGASSKAFFVDPATDLPDIYAILDGLAAGALSS